MNCFLHPNSRPVLSAQLARLLIAGAVSFLLACGEKNDDDSGDEGTPEPIVKKKEETSDSVASPNPEPAPAESEKSGTPETPGPVAKQEPEPEPATIDEPPATVNEPEVTAPVKPKPKPKPRSKPPIKSPIAALPAPEKEVTPELSLDRIAADKLAQDKSEGAKKAMLGFLEAKSTTERLKWIRNASKLEDKVVAYHASHPNGGFRVRELNITGAGYRLDEPSKHVFPYYMATDKNPYGFLVLIYEEARGMKLSWEQFVFGHDYPLHDFIVGKDQKPREFLAAIIRAHIFDPDIPESERAKLFAVTLDLPRVGLTDKPVAYVDMGTDLAKRLTTALPWGKRQLCRVTLQHDTKGKLRVKRYGKLAHPLK